MTLLLEAVPVDTSSLEAAQLAETTAREIARLAHAESKATGRPCRLQDVSAIRAFLLGLLSGKSLYAASVSAQLSDGAVRRWIKLGADDNVGACGALAQAVAAVPEARQALEESKRPTTAAPVTEPIANTATQTAQSIPPLQIHAWKYMLQQAEERQRGTDLARYEAQTLRQQMRFEMEQCGWDPRIPLPTELPRLDLPRDLSCEQIRTAYIKFCQRTGRPTRELDVDLNMWGWFHEHKKQD